jgi:hypothetical protein
MAPDQGSTVDFFLFSRLKNIMKGALLATFIKLAETVSKGLFSWRLRTSFCFPA